MVTKLKTPTRTDFIELHALIRTIGVRYGYTQDETDSIISTLSYGIYRGLFTFDSILRKLLERINNASDETQSK
jgi:hypothetical protein